ncbi:exo-alpha-sialidase [Aquincola sp. S2]|uniref:Exo-alpha-sialidase n=1 Tax=Pseudaquabacterium terrae TaxID=2732868 RepID=A0ABX2ES88_9BURK|nr:sialidase family protein [Aquabacterium terrae]NRF71468.1 exo-alpha-sialidase [Aquabacterium terrae]
MRRMVALVHSVLARLVAAGLLASPMVASALQPAQQIGWRLELSGPAERAELTLITDVPAADQGQPALQFLAAELQGAWYCYGGQPLGWAPCSTPLPAHSQGALPAQARLALGTHDTLALRGAQLHAGYGTSADEMLAAGRHRRVAALGPARSVDWSDAQTVPGSTNVVLAFNNTALALRDATGVLHLVWADGGQGWHGRHDGQAWSVAALPKAGGGSIDKPTLALLADGELLLAWSEQAGSTRQLLVARSRDGRSRWDLPLTLASGNLGSAVALESLQGGSGVAGAVVAWIDEGAGRVLSRQWSGSGWSLGDWSPALSPAAAAGVPHDIGLASFGQTVWATWEDKRSGAGDSEIYLARSTDSGLSWQVDRRLPLTAGSPAGGDPSLQLLPDGRLLLAYQHQNKVWFTLSADGGTSFAPAVSLGPGLFAHVAANQRGSVAFTWEHFSSGGAQNDSGKTVGSTLSLDALARVEGPHAMPGSEAVTYAVQAAAAVAHDRIDVFWVDAAPGGARVIRWRSGRLVD